jgi:hypothetical protein
MSNMEDCYEECPMCLVTLSPDSTINQLRGVLREISIMLDGSMAPHIDARDVDRWLEKRRELLARVSALIGEM